MVNNTLDCLCIFAVSCRAVNKGGKELDELREIFLLLTQSSQTPSAASNRYSHDTDDTSHIPLSDR